MMVFKNREQAAHLLAEKLIHLKGKNPLILAIPRGALPLGAILAERLQGELDVVLVHKVGSQRNPEYAIGSVSEFGQSHVTDHARFKSELDYFQAQAHREIERLKQRRQAYSPVRPPISPQHRTVVIVDDGIATGATVLAAIHAIRPQKPERLIVAAPVTSTTARDQLKPQVDDFIVLDVPEDFGAISQFYESFPQVSDEQAIQILKTGPSLWPAKSGQSR